MVFRSTRPIAPYRLAGDRSFPAFLRAVRSEPGFGFRLAALGAFGIGLLIGEGVATLALWGGLGVAVGVAIGYPYFRTRGRLLGGVKRVRDHA